MKLYWFGRRVVEVLEYRSARFRLDTDNTFLLIRVEGQREVERTFMRTLEIRS